MLSLDRIFSFSSFKELLESGAHYGHPVSKWNPQFKPFIATKKNGIYIINLQLTLDYLKKAVSEMKKITEKGGNILFEGKPKDLIRNKNNQTGIYLKKYQESLALSTAS